MKQCAGRSEERKSWSDFRWVHHYHQPLCGNEKVSEPFGQWGGCRSLSLPFHTRRRAIDTVVHGGAHDEPKNPTNDQPYSFQAKIPRYLSADSCEVCL